VKSSQSSDAPFRDSRHGIQGLASPILHRAKEKPGRLLVSTEKEMHGTLHPGRAAAGFPLILNQSLRQADATHSQLEGWNYREQQTISLAGNQIRQGNWEKGEEILLQKWNRVKAVAAGLLLLKAAERLELLPLMTPTSLSIGKERRNCIDESEAAKPREENERLPTKSVLKNWLGGESCLSFPKPRSDTASSSARRSRRSGRCATKTTSWPEGELATAHSDTSDDSERREGGGKRCASLPS